MAPVNHEKPGLDPEHLGEDMVQKNQWDSYNLLHTDFAPDDLPQYGTDKIMLNKMLTNTMKTM